MQQFSRFLRPVVAVAALVGLAACQPAKPELQWQPLELPGAHLHAQLPCAPQMARTPVDFGVDIGQVTVSIAGCDADQSTYAVSHWLLDDAKLADDALAFWQAAVLMNLKPLDGEGSKSGAAFVPEGAMPLSRSIRATVEGVGPSGWTITTHGVWFARQEGEKARIYHAVIYAPKPQHEVATAFFNRLQLQLQP